MGYPWTYEEKLLVWRHAGARVRREQWEQNERDADLVERMTDVEIRADAIATYGGRAAATRASEMCRRVIQETMQRLRPTRH